MYITEVEYSEVLKMRNVVMYPEMEEEFVKLSNDDEALHIGVFDKGELMTVVSLFIQDNNLQFRKLATRTDMQHNGYASELMNWIIDYASDVKFNKIWCNARVETSSFYEKFFFTKTEDHFTKNGFDYVVMERII